MDIAAILSKKYFGSEWTLNGDSYEGLTWLSKTDKPSEQELLSQWEQVKTLIADEITAKATAKAALLERLGITAEEAALLLA